MVTGSMEVLSVQDLSKAFGDQQAIRSLSFTLESGNVVGLLGPNGSGKTTALSCITGILQPSTGTISIYGKEHNDINAKDNFGFLADDLPMPDSLSGREMLSFYQRLRPHYDTDMVTQLLNLMGLTAALDNYFGNYSHGMKRKLNLALTLGHRPQLLILDEPMRGLDPEAARIIHTIIQDYKKTGRTVLMATHDLSAASTSCDHVIIMSGGSMVLQGKPKTIMAEHNADSLEDVFIDVTGLKTSLDAKITTLHELLLPETLPEKETAS